jgi:hypothetical protein
VTKRPFTKNSHGRIFTFFTVTIFIAAALFIAEGCEKSDYEKALTGESIASNAQASDTAPNSTVLDIQQGEITGADSGSDATSGTTEDTTTGEVTETNITDDYLLKYIEKSLNIKALGAFHSSLNIWSSQVNISKSNGEAAGYIFISYVEAALDGASTEINTSVLKANLKGTVDMKTLDFKGWVTGNILADRDDFFSGSIDLETTGKLSADFSQFTGNFTTPSLVIFDFILKKE